MTAETLPVQTPAVPAPASAGAGPRPLVIGIDSSLTSLGIATPDSADALRWKGSDRGHDRIEWLRTQVLDRSKAADLVVIEGPSYGSKMLPGQHELAGLWWILTHGLWRRGIPYAVASPHSRTIYATGAAFPAKDHPKDKRARIAKGMVHTFVAEKLGIWCEGSGRYDASDAATLAAMGMHWLGYPLTIVPASHARALDGVRWPDLPAVAR
jgi:hypothetical protein